MSLLLWRLPSLIVSQLPTMFHSRSGEREGQERGFLFCAPRFALFFRFQIEIVFPIVENRQSAWVRPAKSSSLLLFSDESHRIGTVPVRVPCSFYPFGPNLRPQFPQIVELIFCAFIYSHPTWNRWRPIEQPGHRNRRRTFAHRFRQFYDLVVCHLDCRSPVYATVSTPSVAPPNNDTAKSRS